MFSLPPWTSAELRCDDPMPPVGQRCVVCGCVTVNKFTEYCFSHFRPVSLAAVIAEKRELLARLQDEPEALQRKSCIAAVLGELEELRMVHDDDAEASEPDAPSAGSGSEREEAPDGGAGPSDAPSAGADAPSAGSGSEPEEAPDGGTGHPTRLALWPTRLALGASRSQRRMPGNFGKRHLLALPAMVSLWTPNSGWRASRS